MILLSQVTLLKDKVTVSLEQLQVELQTLRDESFDIERLRGKVKSVVIKRDGLKKNF